jgi:rRNA processing protein Krr1/Pno1
VETVTKALTVEARKLGLLIGPKGVTKIGLQTATGTDIQMPKVEKDFNGPVEITITGTDEGVERALFALNEMVVKGYSTILASPDFHEGYVEVKPKFLPDIIGKGGASIKAIQAHTGVKISTPSGYTKTAPSGETITPSKVKIVLAGSKDKVAIARGLILDLTKYFHTPVTHPGVVHAELEIPSNYFNYIIGSKGSEIKHIQANYKVTVYVPGSDSLNENLLIVGEESAVQKAEQHIRRLIEKVDTQAAERAKAEAEGAALGENAKARYAAGTAAGEAREPRSNSNNRAPRAPREGGAPATGAAAGKNGAKTAEAPKDKDEDRQEEWMNEFAPRRAPINLNNILPATAKFAAAPPALPAPASPVPAADETVQAW